MSKENKNTRSFPNHQLQRERLVRGWTQQDVANHVGTTVVNVSRWERGITLPSPYFRQKLCTLFAKNAEELGLFVSRQPAQHTTYTANEESTADVPEKALQASNPHMTAISPPLQKRSRRIEGGMLAGITLLLVVLIGGGMVFGRLMLSARPGSSAHAGAAPVPVLVGNTIAQDTFHRHNQIFWGTASDGLSWQGDANTAKNFSIVNNAAQIATAPTGDNYSAIIGPKVRDGGVLFTGSLSRFDDTNLGSILRWQDTNHWYKAYITGSELVIQKRVSATDQIPLNSIHFAAQTNVLYTIRFQIVGTLLMAKVWARTNQEPANWMLTAHDDTYKEGFCGLRIRVHFDTSATVTSFQAISIT